MSVKVILVPVMAYTVLSEDGRELVPLMTVQSSWEGLIKLVANGQTLVCEKPGAMQQMMAAAGPLLGTKLECDVIKASPDLLDKLVNKPGTTAEGGAA